MEIELFCQQRGSDTLTQRTADTNELTPEHTSVAVPELEGAVAPDQNGVGVQLLGKLLFGHGVLVLTGKAYITAQRNGAQRIIDFFSPPAQKLRAEADGKFYNTDAAQAAGEVMTEFMNGNDKPKEKVLQKKKY